MPGNRPAWILWKLVKTQWRTAGFGLVGLDYGVVRVMAREFGIRLSVGLWRKIQALEEAALAAQAPKKKDKGG